MQLPSLSYSLWWKSLSHAPCLGSLCDRLMSDNLRAAFWRMVSQDQSLLAGAPLRHQRIFRTKEPSRRRSRASPQPKVHVPGSKGIFLHQTLTAVYLLQPVPGLYWQRQSRQEEFICLWDTSEGAACETLVQVDGDVHRWRQRYCNYTTSLEGAGKQIQETRWSGPYGFISRCEKVGRTQSKDICWFLGKGSYNAQPLGVINRSHINCTSMPNTSQTQSDQCPTWNPLCPWAW